MHSAAYILAAFTLGSSLLAFVRDRLLAHAFGAGHELDLYYAAFRIPDLLFVTVASLVSVYVLIPELERRSNDTDRRTYIRQIVSGFALVMVASAAILWVATPALVASLFPRFSHDELVTLAMLSRLLLLQPILLGFSNILAAVVQAKSRYVLYAITPLAYNGGIIFGIVVLYPILGLSGLVWGAIIGALLHVSVQLPTVLSDGYLRTFQIMMSRDEWSVVLRTALVSLPRTLALSSGQLVTLALVSLAGGFVSGSIAIFTFATNLIAVPLAVIGASYSVAAFPVLAAMLSRGEREAFVEHVSTAARHIIFWSVPATGLLIVLRAYIVRAILGTGAFDWTDTRLTAAAFALFSFSLAASALTLLIVRAYFAAGRSFVPFAVSSVSGLFAIGLAYVLASVRGPQLPRYFAESLMRVSDVPGTEVLMLPLAYSVAVLCGTFVLMFMFERQFNGFLRQIRRVLGESVAAATAGGTASYFALTILGSLEETTTLSAIVLHGALAGLVGLLAALGMFILLGSRECFEALEAGQRRVWRTRPIGSVEAEAVL
jgi:putative peptidoglycan lipid II flippase